jgi:hypothetical protein
VNGCRRRASRRVDEKKVLHQRIRGVRQHLILRRLEAKVHGAGSTIVTTAQHQGNERHDKEDHCPMKCMSRGRRGRQCSKKGAWRGRWLGELGPSGPLRTADGKNSSSMARKAVCPGDVRRACRSEKKLRDIFYCSPCVRAGTRESDKEDLV